MKTTRQAQRDARRLFRLCTVDRSLDETLVRRVVSSMIEAGRPGVIPVLVQLQRLVRLDRARQTAVVESAAPLAADERAGIESGLARVYGPAVRPSFSENAALIGGVRITVGSDVYDGSVRARLAALERRL